MKLSQEIRLFISERRNKKRRRREERSERIYTQPSLDVQQQCTSCSLNLIIGKKILRERDSLLFFVSLCTALHVNEGDGQKPSATTANVSLAD